MQEYKITADELRDITGFIAEATEIIDSLVTGNNHTYFQLADSGLIVKPVKRFMRKHKKHIPETQAMYNQKQRTKELAERAKDESDKRRIEAEGHDGTLEKLPQ